MKNSLKYMLPMLVSLFLLEIGLYFILEFHSANFSWSIGTHAREAVIPVGIKKWRGEIFIFPRYSEWYLSLKCQIFAVK